MTANRRIHEPFVYAALLMALTAGFGLAAILVAVIAFDLPKSAWWLAAVQVHGHAQLFGWTGLFVLGVGLYFLPRLRGTTLAREQQALWILAFFGSGIVLRALSQMLLAIDSVNRQADLLWNLLPRVGLAASGILEMIGTALWLFVMFYTFRQARPLVPDSPIQGVKAFLAVSIASLVLAVLINGFLSIQSALQNVSVFSSSWDNVVILLMVFGFTIPIAFAFSVRNLPLFMRLAVPPIRALNPILASYVTGVSGRLIGELAEQPFGSAFTALGMVLQGASVLVFIWTLDVLLRRKEPWRVSRVSPPPGYVETRKPTRTRYPDYGEYGRFELLILSAYVWLALASLTALVNGLWLITVGNTLVNPDVERHTLTVGFVTLLIFGMAVRMLPGFSGKRHVASTTLVLATFIIGNAAALFRLVPLLIPDLWIANVAFGISGAVGWVAIACLGVNLWWTFRS